MTFLFFVNLYFIGSKRVEHGQQIIRAITSLFIFFTKKEHISDETFCTEGRLIGRFRITEKIIDMLLG
jgi:hypothetical protein